MLSFMDAVELNAGFVWLIVDVSIGLLLLLIYPLLAVRFRPPLFLIYWVIIPYLGLISGGLSPRLMGLTGINWLASFGLGLGLIGILLVLLLFIRTLLNLARDEPTGAQSSRPAAHQGWEAAVRAQPQAGGWSLWPVLQVGAEEFHWAFLRGALWETLLNAGFTILQASYWALWLAALLAVPAIWRNQATPIQRLLKGAILLITTVLFFYTRNFWLCWFLHSIAWGLLNPHRLPHPHAMANITTSRPDVTTR